MAASRKSVQVARIARLLGVDSGAVSGLDAVPEDDLRALHDQISRALFDDAREGFTRIAGLAAHIPSSLAGALAMRFVPPVIAARVTEVMEPERAKDLVGRLGLEYLADVATALDPVRAQPVLRALPPARVGEISAALFGRGEHAVMAEFADSLSVEALDATLEVASLDDLRAIAPFVTWTEDLRAVASRLPPDRAAALQQQTS